MDSNERGCKPSPFVKLTHTAAPSSESIGLIFPSFRTCENWGLSKRVAWGISTLFAEDSHAKTSVCLAPAQDSPGRAPDSGANSADSSKRLRRGSSSSKMSLRFDLEDWQQFFATSMRSGLMRSGTVYPLPPLAHLISVIGYGLLPTLRASDGSKSSSMSIRRREAGRPIDALPDALRILYGNGSISPEFGEWFMGYPIGWTELARLEIP